ncbi:MAG: structural protein P5 [Prevotella sp.]|nr:structural protein P5 [Prevotella sp.]MCM1443672.1 structural protein P5 [Muribaculum sp.]MCM1577145.1 structural protein P5 [Bacteroides sp.]
MKKSISISSAIILAGCAVGFWFAYSKKKTTTTTGNNNSTMNNSNLPRGYRNNNPLNIRISSNNWQGKLCNNTDGAFEQFVSMAYGYRAAMVLISNYITKYNCTTIAQIISRWAPTNENNTAGYISRVCSQTGYTRGTVISPTNEAQMCNLVYAMSLVENGYNPLPDSDAIRQAWKLYV